MPSRSALPEDFSRALKIAEETKSGLDELASINDIASLHLARGELKDAETGFSKGWERAQALKLLRPQSGLLIGLARTSVASGKPAEAEPLLRHAIEHSQGIHQDGQTAEAYTVLGRLAESAGRDGDAKSDFSQAAELFAKVQDKAGLAQVDSSLGRVEAAAGDFDAALGHRRAAIAIIESSRTSFSRGNPCRWAAGEPSWRCKASLLSER